MPPNSNQHNIVQKDVQIAHSGLSIVWGVEGGGGGGRVKSGSSNIKIYVMHKRS